MTVFLRYFFAGLGVRSEKIRREQNNNSDISQTAGGVGYSVCRRIRSVCVWGGEEYNF